MRVLVKIGRGLFATALLVYGGQQFYFGSFRNVFVSAYQTQWPALRWLSFVFGAYLMLSGWFLLNGKKGRTAMLVLATVLLFLLCGTQLTYQFFTEPNRLYHLGVWTNPLKECALVGGALVMAASFEGEDYGLLRWIGKLAPYGNLLFLFTMLCFGLCHLVYGPFLQHYVPAWWPDHLFWVYLTGVALCAGSISIMLGIRIRVIALLMALMLLSWFWMVHLPAALASPVANRGDQLASAFDALAFCGIALVMAATMRVQYWVDQVENW